MRGRKGERDREVKVKGKVKCKRGKWERRGKW